MGSVMAHHSRRVQGLALGAVVLMCQQSSVTQGSALESDASEGRQAAFSLSLQREIPLEHPLSFPADGGWLLRSVVAMHPDGTRALVLIPGERRIALRPRPSSGLSERGFVLAWVDFSTGQFSHSTELRFTEEEGFGFSMAPGGDLVCVIAGQRVMILDERLSPIMWRASEITDPQGGQRVASSCSFVAGTSAVLVAFVLRRTSLLDVRTSLMQWNWKENSVSLFHLNSFLPDTLSLREDLVVTSRTLPNQLYLIRFEERNLRTQEVSWVREYEAHITSKLALSNKLVFSVGGFTGLFLGGSDLTATSMVHANKLLGVRIDGNRYLLTDDRVRVWDRGSDERGREFRLRGLTLQWPLCISHDESWFAARAVSFSHYADNGTLRWNSNQFVVFSLDDLKRRLYLSEKFGPDEAITGLAVSGDDKTLLVTTSRRVLVYEVNAVESRK